MVVIFSGCIISMGYAVGYNIDTTLQEHIKYLELCSNGLPENPDDLVFCHRYDISVRSTQ